MLYWTETRLKPVTAVECLKRIRDKVSLLLDLTFYFLQQPDREFGEALRAIGQEVRTYSDWLIVHVVSAVAPSGTPDLALPFVEFVHQIRRIVDTVLDFVKLLDLGYRPPLLLRVVEESEEYVGILEVSANLSVRELVDKLDLAIDIIAVKHGGRWVIDPDEKQILVPGDLIVFRTNRDAVKVLETSAFVKVRKPALPPAESGDRGVSELVRELAYMKSISEVTFDLACLAILTRDRAVLSELEEIEQLFDVKHVDVQQRALELVGSTREILPILRFVVCLEEIVDASLAIARLVREYPDVTPVLQRALQESDEVLLRFRVMRGGMTLEELKLDSLGLTVIALKRDGEYLVLPLPSTRLRDGDVLVVKGYKQSIDEVRRRLDKLLTPL